MNRAGSVGEVLALYESWGSERYDEELSQLEHALQTAALATAAEAPDELVAAALLHDVGHLLELQANGQPGVVTDDDHHEATGAAYLGGLFGAGVTAPIALHVRAKRYLCAVDRDYRESLSSGSTASLARQGGAFTEDESAAFLRNSEAESATALRRWDDGGKVLGLEVPPFSAYVDLLDRLAR